MKRFLTLIFGDWGLLITSAITAVLSAILFPPFMMQIGGGILKTALAVLLGILAVGFYASSFLTATILSIRSGISKKWALMALSLVVTLVDVIILIINLV